MTTGFLGATASVSANANQSTLVDLLTCRSQQQADQVGYRFLSAGTELNHLTYGELDRQARSIAAQLQALNTAGERALLLYPPGLDFIAAFFGCLYAKVVAVPAYPPRRNQNLSRLQAIVTDAQAKVILSNSTIQTNIQSDVNQTLDISAMHWLATDELASDANSWQPPQLSADDLAFLQYTSGSTGAPKGVMITHGNLLHNSAVIQQCFAHTANSQGLIWLPPYHDMGLIGGVLQPLYANFPVALMSPVDFLQKPFRWLQAISHYRATTSGGPNFAFDLCVQKISPEQRATLDLSSWDLAFTGAEPVRAETLDTFAATFAECGFRREAFYPCYGMAESTLIISGGLKTAQPTLRQVQSSALEQNRVVEVTDAQTDEDDVRSIIGCGWGWLDQKIAIVDPNTKTVCPPGAIGEIWVSSSSVAKGYWNQPDQTEQLFHAHLADTGEGPFLRTEDLGFWQDGELFITGRLKDIIIIRGQNHYPQDIELTVARSHPALKLNSGAAFSVDFKGSEKLVVAQEVDRTHLSKLDVKTVVSNIRQAVSAQHGLEVYAVVLVKTGRIPKTSSGKIRRHACKAAFLTGSLEMVDDWSENPQGASSFLNLQADVDSLLQKLQAHKQ
ncbi:fatty acyl-AMP ligase [Microcoleus sp. FACHB-1515]|uniref:AMP-binding protein n=1 Tax=Cyanophyceae TaxID=3028117 RepID=UPI00168503EB|nr:AMP-binding protein [Microcoleus sp. FACHB-1515]MBD2091223.1 fatty acyl-AMP ligase [Microcoleus sp. FACHB-1515]